MNNITEKIAIMKLLRKHAEQLQEFPVRIAAVSKTTGSWQDKHWHREAHYVIAGEALWEQNDGIYAVKPNSVIPTGRWQPHGIADPQRAVGSVHVVLHFNDILWGTVSILLPELRWGICEWTWAAIDKNLSDFVRKRWDLFDKAVELPKPQAFKQLLQIPLALLYQEYVRILVSRASSTATPTHTVIDLVKSRIENMHGRNCSLEQIAQYTGYSRYRIAHLFRLHTGTTIGAYINEARQIFITRAEVGDISSKQIAAELGFRSTNAYYNWRRKTQLNGK